jgi:hypothetical protein
VSQISSAIFEVQVGLLEEFFFFFLVINLKRMRLKKNESDTRRYEEINDGEEVREEGWDELECRPPKHQRTTCQWLE